MPSGVAVKPDPTWQKWAAWLGKEPKKGTIYEDVVGMMAARQLWEGFQAIVGVAPKRAKQYETFHSWFNGSYIRSQGLAIRRQVEVSDDVVTLGRLLDRIAKAPNILSRDRYLAELHPDDRRLGNEFFDQLTAPGAKAIDPAVPRAHLERLRRETANIRRWVNKEVAHYDTRTGQFSQGLTFGDIHRAIDLIFETMNHYNRLILSSTTAGSVTMPPWEAVFTVAWLPDDTAWHQVAEIMQGNDRRRLGG